MLSLLKTRLTSRIAAAVLAVALVAALPLAAVAQSAKLTLLHVNDVYQISP